jgi:TolB protein
VFRNAPCALRLERSPDGKKIAFGREPVIEAGYHMADSEIFVMNADGTDVHQLTRHGDLEDPVWSPDGKQIAFDDDVRGADLFQIYLVDADGSHLHTLTPTTQSDLAPAWSPDGTSIAFENDDDPDGHDLIYAISAGGSHEQELSP